MTRIFFSLLVLSLVGGFTGCYHTHGVCDCDHDEAPCTHRYPYASSSPAPVGVPVAGVTTAPPPMVQPPPAFLPIQPKAPSSDK